MGIGVIASVLMSCQRATDDTGLAALECKSHECPKFYPAYIAKNGRQVDSTFFAQVAEGMHRMGSELPVDLLSPGRCHR